MEKRNTGGTIVLLLWFFIFLHAVSFGLHSWASIALYVLLPLTGYLSIVLVVFPFFTKRDNEVQYQYGRTLGLTFSAFHILMCITLVFAGVAFFFYNNNIVPLRTVLPMLLKGYAVAMGAFLCLSFLLKHMQSSK